MFNRKTGKKKKSHRKRLICLITLKSETYNQNLKANLHYWKFKCSAIIQRMMIEVNDNQKIIS